MGTPFFNNIREILNFFEESLRYIGESPFFDDSANNWLVILFTCWPLIRSKLKSWRIVLSRKTGFPPFWGPRTLHFILNKFKCSSSLSSIFINLPLRWLFLCEKCHLSILTLYDQSINTVCWCLRTYDHSCVCPSVGNHYICPAYLTLSISKSFLLLFCLSSLSQPVLSVHYVSISFVCLIYSYKFCLYNLFYQFSLNNLVLLVLSVQPISLSFVCLVCSYQFCLSNQFLPVMSVYSLTAELLNCNS